MKKKKKDVPLHEFVIHQILIYCTQPVHYYTFSLVGLVFFHYRIKSLYKEIYINKI
jgi:hypothetical protein